jgi:hypothetical protein
MDNLYYKSGYKYQLTRDFTSILPIELELQGSFENHFIKLVGRELTARRHYATDGPSGPTIDTKTFMRAAVRHDIGYQLIRLGVYPESSRILWDKLLREDCKADGMMSIRAQWVYMGVRAFGGSSANPNNEKPELVAP